MKQLRGSLAVPVTILSLAVTSLSARSEMSPQLQGQASAIITVLPSRPSEQLVPFTAHNIRLLKVEGKEATVKDISSLRNGPVELVFLIEPAARLSFSTQLNEFTKFINEPPPHTRIAVAYMMDGRADFATPLFSNPAAAVQAMRLPAGPRDAIASPYICISNLAKNWPSQDPTARREVLLITDGIDDYSPAYDPDDPYVQAAIADSVRAHIILNAIFWRDQSRVARSGWGENTGQSLLSELTESTGGINFWKGFGSPVTVAPYLRQLREMLADQYLLSFTAPIPNKQNKAEVHRLQIKLAVPAAKVISPQLVVLEPVNAPRP